jgi:hypothetical protein
VGPWAVEEEISRRDKSAIRQKLLDALRSQLEQMGGVWLCVSAYPFPYRSAMNFRFDYDEYHAAGFGSALRATVGNEDCTSHFVCASAFAEQPDALLRLRGLDIGAHGQWHHTYRTKEENLANVSRGIQALRESGIEARGFAAPHGRFNAELLAALDELGVTHSSEFGLAYDDLPFFPNESHVLQIPVHPVCLELFVESARRRAHADDPMAIDRAVAEGIGYFQETALRKYRAGEPLFFYGHPVGPWGEQPHVLSAILAAVASCQSLWRVTMTEFGAWWRVRGGLRIRVARDGEQYAVTAEHPPADYPITVELWRGRHVARMRLEHPALRFSPAALAYETRTAAAGVRPARVERPHGLRSHLRRLIDWEKVTPVDQIAPLNWRNIAKRALRRWRQSR